MSKIERLIPLRCPGCNALINVRFRQEFARCAMCGHEWKWKRQPKRMTFARGIVPVEEA